MESNIQETLKNLQLDYLDLYLMHWPVAMKKGVGFPESADDFVSLEEIPLIDTWQAMEQLKAKGLTKHIGVSNFNIPKIQGLIDAGGSVPEMNQVESHPLLAQKELLEFCKSMRFCIPPTRHLAHEIDKASLAMNQICLNLLW